jgi:tRNA (guanine10-N2)-methyltransferase
MDYLIRLVQLHQDFRLAEIRSLASFFTIHIQIISYSATSPFLVLRILTYPSQVFSSPKAAAQALISRSVLSWAIYELWGMTSETEASYAALHADVKTRTNPAIWAQYKASSFKFSIDAYCGKRSPTEQTEIIDGFRYLGFQGLIQMQSPEIEFTTFEDWSLAPSPAHLPSKSSPDPTSQGPPSPNQLSSHSDPAHEPRRPQALYLGLLLSTSPRHVLTLKHSLKQRPYISTTSMDAVLALVSANIAHAGPGRIIYDPFVGTGGFLVAAAEFGAAVWGSDIDGRSFRGTGKGGRREHGDDGGVGRMEGRRKGVWRNFDEYGLADLFGDCLISDLVNTPLRIDGAHWLDGIICDPPYGVREGLKVLGNREERPDKTPVMIDGVPAHLLPGYVAPKKPYSFERMLNDLLTFAADTLVEDGRLAFWMPSANEDDDVLETPSHEMLEMVECCVQRFYKWSRRLLVYRRKREGEGEGEGEGDGEGKDKESVRPGKNDKSLDDGVAHGKTASDLNPFRRKYFQGFQT